MTAPAPCPRCGGLMGDGDRVTAGVCGPCRFRRRRAPRTTTDQGARA